MGSLLSANRGSAPAKAFPECDAKPSSAHSSPRSTGTRDAVCQRTNAPEKTSAGSGARALYGSASSTGTQEKKSASNRRTVTDAVVNGSSSVSVKRHRGRPTSPPATGATKTAGESKKADANPKQQTRKTEKRSDPKEHRKTKEKDEIKTQREQQRAEKHRRRTAPLAPAESVKTKSVAKADRTKLPPAASSSINKTQAMANPKKRKESISAGSPRHASATKGDVQQEKRQRRACAPRS